MKTTEPPFSEPKNPVLVRAMQDCTENDNPQTRREFYRALLQSILLLPIPEPVAGLEERQWTTLGKGKPLALITGQGPDGQPVLLAFTDTEAMAAWRPEGGHYVAIRAVDLLPQARQHNMAAIVLNPAGPASVQIMPREIKILAEGMLPEYDEAGVSKATVTQDTTVLVGAPMEEPSAEFVSKLRQALARYAEVAAGYLLQMVIGTGEPHLVVGVRLFQPLDPQALGKLMHELGLEIQPALGAGGYIDLVVLEGELLRSAEKATPPIFRRPTLRFTQI